MSTHYHAAQARGFAFSTYEVQVEQWHTAFTGFDPARIAGILGLTYDSDCLYLTYMNRPYRLRLADGVLEKKLNSTDICSEENSPSPAGAAKDPSGEWTDGLFFNEAMSIYHHLYYTVDQPRPASGTWVATSELEGLRSRNTRLPDPLLDPFALHFTGKCELLADACTRLGGTRLNRGDVSFRFTTFPQIPLQIVFWDSDEDFPAQLQVLADSHAVDYMHRETIGCIVCDLLDLIEQAAGIAEAPKLPEEPSVTL